MLEWIGRPWAKFRGVVGLAGKAFVVHYGKTLPHVIGLGEVWSCRVKLLQMEALYRGGTPKIELSATCWNRPRLFRIPRMGKEAGVP